jgi:hypothetical protein
MVVAYPRLPGFNPKSVDVGFVVDKWIYRNRK